MTTLFLTEYYSQQEAQYQMPFVGSDGQEFFRILHQAGWHGTPLAYNYISAMTMWNKWRSFPHKLLPVFPIQPEKNDVGFFYGTRDEKVDRTFPVRKFGASNHYVRDIYVEQLNALRTEITNLQPNLIIACGSTATWFLGLGTAISNLRGFIHSTPYGKVLPIHSPSAVLKNWTLRAPTLLDLIKARRESTYPDIRVPSREIWTEPTIDDLWSWWELHGSKAELIAFDIETLKKKVISEISFASGPSHALHIPFIWQEGKEFKTWWPDVKTETEAWKFVKHVLESDIPKLGQNVVQYDTYWLVKQMNIVPKNILHDTMIASHAWQPELEKSLRFLGSIFLTDASWKSIRHETNKQDD
jgi:uracil-DNA glycosylase